MNGCFLKMGRNVTDLYMTNWKQNGRWNQKRENERQQDIVLRHKTILYYATNKHYKLYLYIQLRIDTIGNLLNLMLLLEIVSSPFECAKIIINLSKDFKLVMTSNALLSVKILLFISLFSAFSNKVKSNLYMF